MSAPGTNRPDAREVGWAFLDIREALEDAVCECAPEHLAFLDIIEAEHASLVEAVKAAQKFKKLDEDCAAEAAVGPATRWMSNRWDLARAELFAALEPFTASASSADAPLPVSAETEEP